MGFMVTAFFFLFLGIYLGNKSERWVWTSLAWKGRGRPSSFKVDGKEYYVFEKQENWTEPVIVETVLRDDRVPDGGRDAWKAIIDEMEARRDTGLLRYGVPIRWTNDEDFMKHLFDELLDALPYLVAMRDRINALERARRQT
jgi:hypothetical protein